jgi:hypothetical protein
MGDRTTITFRDGKVLEGIGAYTVPLRPSRATRTLMTHGLNEGRVITLSIETNLRSMMAKMRIDMRGARKGGLQWMAASGVPIMTLLKFSRHKTGQALYTLAYLEDGAAATAEMDEMLQAQPIPQMFVTDSGAYIS